MSLLTLSSVSPTPELHSTLMALPTVSTISESSELHESPLAETTVLNSMPTDGASESNPFATESITGIVFDILAVLCFALGYCQIRRHSARRCKQSHRWKYSEADVVQ